jgi:hypothetical protein
LSPTYEGKRHDKKIVDEEQPTFPQHICLYKDTWFQGYDPEGIVTFQPQKKPKEKELTPEQKEHNTLISSVRIVIEHIINGIKRCRIVSSPYTFFLLNDDIELHRNRHFFIQKVF